MIRKCGIVGGIVLLMICGVAASHAAEVEASPAQGINVTVYDTGVSMVRERRLMNLASGENSVILSGVPESLDVSSVSFSPPASVMGVALKSLQLQFDMASVGRALAKYVKEIITVSTAERQFTGRLLHVDSDKQGNPVFLSLVLSDGSVEIVKWTDVQSLNFPDGAKQLSSRPVLLWQIDSAESQVQNFRVNYIMYGVMWRTDYDLLLSEERGSAELEGRFCLENHSDIALEGAKLRVIATEQGLSLRERTREQVDHNVLRNGSKQKEYVLGTDALQSAVAYDGLSPVYTHTVDQRISLEPGEQKYYQYLALEDLPVEQSYVYDGVVFDRYQRNRRADWNYGTESRPDVFVYVAFQNDDSVGHGEDLAPGNLRLLQRRKDGTLDVLGDTLFRGAGKDSRAEIRVGPAKGLRGNRERVGYSEVVPLHEYEETFEIELENNTEQDAVIRVVEHLYRWSVYEIVRADTDYEVTGENQIEFSPIVKAQGSRAIRYTVRYRW